MVTHEHSEAHDAEQGCHLDPWWVDGALRAIATLAATGEVFSADQPRAEPFSIPEPSHPNHWGGLWAKAKAEDLIKPVGYASSRTASRNGGVLRLWRGTGRQAVAA
jgi:hypothetical protein